MDVNKEIIELIIRQTNYNEDEAKQKLLEYNNDYLKVIKNYMSSENNIINTEKKTTNQLMYGEFRTFLDDACKNYRIKKDKEDKINQIIENIKIQNTKSSNN